MYGKAKLSKDFIADSLCIVYPYMVNIITIIVMIMRLNKITHLLITYIVEAF